MSKMRSSFARQRGITIIELMVGITISMLVGLAAVATALTFNASQRQSVGTSGSAANLVTALGAIKSEVAPAGLGFYNDKLFLCPKLNFSVGATTLANNATFTPLQVTRTAGLDRIDVMYATDIRAGARAVLKGDLSSDVGSIAYMSSLVNVANPAVAASGPTVLLSGDPATNPCTIRTVTAMSAADGLINKPQSLTFGNAGQYNQVALTSTTYPANKGRVSLLGDVVMRSFRVTGGNLVMDLPMTGQSAILVRDVVFFQVQYGISSSAITASIDKWVDPVNDAINGNWSAVTAANINRIRALRVGIIARSGQAERGASGTACTSSASEPAVSWRAAANDGFAWQAKADVSGNADWRCFRYRAETMVIPMRNIVLGRA